MHWYIYISIIFSVNIAVLFSFPINICAKNQENDNESYVEYYDFTEIEKILNKNAEYKEIDFEEIIKELISGESDNVIGDSIKIIFSNFTSEVRFGIESLSKIIIIAVITALLTNFSSIFGDGNISETAYYFTYMILIALLMTAFGTVADIAGNVLEFLTQFMTALIPAYFLSVGVVGSTSAVAFYELSLITIGAVQWIFLDFVMPLIELYVLISIVNNISEKDYLSRFTTLLENIIKMVCKGILGIVLSINVIQALILPSIDGVKNNAFVKLLSAIPGVGNSAGAMSDILLSSGILIKNSIGTGAIIVIIIICAVPLIKIGIFSFAYQVAAAIIQPVSDKRVVNSISGIVNGINMLFNCCKTAGMLFVITIAIICVSTNIS